MSKKEIIKDIITAFEIQDFSKVRHYFTEDFTIHWPGILIIENLSDLELFLKRNAPKQIVETKNQHFIEQGDTIVTNGEITVELHSGLLIKNYFCDIYEFKNEKVKKIISYILHDK